MSSHPLTKLQQTMIEKARNPGSSRMAIPLGDDQCKLLTAVIARDLKRQDLFPDIEWRSLPKYFDIGQTPACSVIGDLNSMLATLFHNIPDSDTYFSCLATLHKSRLKYDQILRCQPMPTFDQVGPRGLLQFGTLSSKSLRSFLFWRKWLYDIDNRAAQDTGYLFEPILAHAIGGVPVSAGKSPVKRSSDPRKGRQVDCIRGEHAYEFKLRVTTAASGQGRWREELTFPVDCRRSGYTPILVVLDPTPSPKLSEIEQVFEKNGGDVYIGENAWRHLEQEAGKTMSIFLENYVRDPLESLLCWVDQPLDELRLRLEPGMLSATIGTETLLIPRDPTGERDDKSELPDDVDRDLPGMG